MTDTWSREVIVSDDARAAAPELDLFRWATRAALRDFPRRALGRPVIRISPRAGGYSVRVLGGHKAVTIGARLRRDRGLGDFFS